MFFYYVVNWQLIGPQNHQTKSSRAMYCDTQIILRQALGVGHKGCMKSLTGLIIIEIG